MDLSAKFFYSKFTEKVIIDSDNDLELTRWEIISMLVNKNLQISVTSPKGYVEIITVKPLIWDAP